jgi:hypothetical protein
MTTKHTIELTCDVCKTKSDEAYSWARVDISGSSANMGLMQDMHYDICPRCWQDKIRPIIYPPKPPRT